LDELDDDDGAGGNFKQKLKKCTLKALTVVLLSVPITIVFFLLLLVYRFEAKISDIFSSERISILAYRPKEFTRDVVIDLSCIGTPGGVTTLTENILQGMIIKRPNWRFIVMGSDEIANTIFKKLENFKNVKIINVEFNCYDFGISEFLQNMLLKASDKRMGDRLIQFFFYGQLFLDHKCDIFWDLEVGSGWLNDFSGVAKVATIHDVAYDDANSNVCADRIEWIKFRTKAAIDNASRIITVSNFSKKRILNLFKKDPNFVQVIPIQLSRRLNGLKPSRLKIQSVLKKYQLIPKKYFIYLSTYWPNKNHRRLLLAFEKYLKITKSDIKLILVGYGGSSVIDSYRKMLQERGFADSVIFSGFMPNEDLQIILFNALFFIHPSLYEGFGIPIVEAMAAGVPVTCSTAGSLPEVAGDAALFFDPMNVDDIVRAIATMISDANLRKVLVKRGYRQAEKFANNDEMIDQYIRVFEEVMQEADCRKKSESNASINGGI
jgi:glycosyltransferase involved in cell wall biosynthesis